MSEYYKGKRTRGIFDPIRHGSGQAGAEPFKLSRSKVELYLECPQCFYLDRRLGVGRPPGFPFSLNAAVDLLLKKEFDTHRAKQEPHPLMKAYGLDAIPYEHRDLDKWRENFVGVQYHHAPTNFIITGAVDDVWVNQAGELHVVDYKATSKDTEVNLDADWQKGYKNQMEIYQWLLRQNGFKVSPTGYFVYVNGKRDAKAFDARLEFDVKLIPYTGDDKWIEAKLPEIKKCLMGDTCPEPSEECDHCTYREVAEEVLGEMKPKVTKSPAKQATQSSLF